MGINSEVILARSKGAIVNGKLKAVSVRNTAMEIRPRKIGLTTRVCFRVVLLFKKAESSNKHHNLVVQLGSHRISMVSDFLSSPARLKIASVFIFLFAWLMQIRSKNTWFLGRQSNNVPLLTSRADSKHQVDHWMS